MHRDLLDTQHLQTLRSGDSYVLRPEDEFARLIVDVQRGCGNVHLLWTPSAIQCLNDLYVGTLTSGDGVYSSLQDNVVGLRRLTARSPIMGCIQFCEWWFFNGIVAV